MYCRCTFKFDGGVFFASFYRNGENLSAGMNYTDIHDNLIVGSQPKNEQDIQLLFDKGVGVILNLQQDKDIQHHRIAIDSIVQKCHQLTIRHKRIPVQDFAPQSLQKELPRAVAELERAISQGKMVYVHCTAGLGRSPAVAIAYLYWFCDMDMDTQIALPFQLDTAYDFLTAKRPCGPNKEAIRGATYDLAKTDPNKPKFESLHPDAFKDISTSERQLIQDCVRKLREQ
jgi:protein-tyrosine phosphatase